MDPTWNREAINKNPIWKAAFIMSECHNDGAPIGWGKYIPTALELHKAGLLIQQVDFDKKKRGKK